MNAPYVAKLGDGGLGRLLVRNEGKPVIPQSAVDHSRGYVDPAYAKKGNVVAASDVYACGVVLLELLSGQLPFTRWKGASLPYLSSPSTPTTTRKVCWIRRCPTALPESRVRSVRGRGKMPLGKAEAALQDPRSFRVVARSAGRDAQLPDGDLIEDGPDSREARGGVSASARGAGQRLRAARQRAPPLRPAPVLQQSPGTRLGRKAITVLIPRGILLFAARQPHSH